VHCAELTNSTEIVKFLPILFRNIALSLAMMSATASAKLFCVKVKKYFAILSLMLQLQESQFQTVTNLQLICIG